MVIKRVEFIGEICNCFFGCNTGLRNGMCTSKHKGKQQIVLVTYINSEWFADGECPTLEPGIYNISIEKISE